MLIKKNYLVYIYGIIIGIFSSLGFYCFICLYTISVFHERYLHPYLFSFSIIIGFFSLIICIIFSTKYISVLIKTSKYHILLSFITIILTFTISLFIWEFLYKIVSNCIKMNYL